MINGISYRTLWRTITTHTHALLISPIASGLLRDDVP